jgi:hypothetical protein
MAGLTYVYLTPKSPLHAMERGLDDRFSPPLRWVERGPGGEVNHAAGEISAVSMLLAHLSALKLMRREGRFCHFQICVICVYLRPIFDFHSTRARTSTAHAPSSSTISGLISISAMLG